MSEKDKRKSRESLTGSAGAPPKIEVSTKKEERSAGPPPKPEPKKADKDDK